jgi:hypothetical protein
VNTPSTQDTTTTEKRTFSSVLFDINKGKTHAQLGDELRALVAAVVETGKAGSLTLRLDVKPLGGNDEGITITGRVASKLPAFATPASVFFVDADLNHKRTPGNQPALFQEPGVR